MMKKAGRGTGLIPVLMLALVMVLSAAPVQAESSAGTRWVEHEAIVSFRPEAVTDTADPDRILAESLGTDYDLLDVFQADDDLVLGLLRCAGRDAEELVSLLSANPEIARAEKNGIWEPQSYDGGGNYEYSLNDALARCQYYLNPPTAVNNAGENALSWGLPAEEAISTRACGLWPEGWDDVVVAVIDTGINPQHEDLKNVLWRNPGNLGLPGNAGDPGYNFLEGSSDVTDTVGHGTHVSGIIAAQANNAAGIAGIASGINVKLMILSTASSSLGGEPPNNAFCFMRSLNYVLQAKRAGVNIVAVNNSWAQGPSSYLYDEMLEKLGEEGIVNFIAAGNNHDDLDITIGSISDTDVAGTVVVGACDIAGNPAGFSNFGRSSVDIYAPGANMLSTYGGSSFFPNLMASEERERTTEYYGQFEQEMDAVILYPGDASGIIPGTGKPSGSGSQSPGSFGALQFHKQKPDYVEDEQYRPSDSTYAVVSVVREKAFTTDYTLKVTLHNPQPLEEYYFWFPYAKNPLTTGTDNTLLSLLAFRGYRDGCYDSTIRGGEILVEIGEGGSRICSVVAGGDAEYQNGPKDSGIAVHIHQNLECFELEKDLLLPYSSLQAHQQVGLGFCITANIPDSDADSPKDKPLILYIDSLGVSIPGKNGEAAPANHGYEIMSGTSMASPAAAACYALIAAQHPRKPGQSGPDYVRETLALFLSTARRSAALEGLCSTGGYADLSLLEKNNPSIVDAVCDIENKTLTLYGQHLTKACCLSIRKLASGSVAELPAEGMSLEYSEDGRTLLIREADPLFNTYLEFILSEGGTVRATKSSYLVKGEAAPEMVFREELEGIGSDCCLLTDAAGEKLYSYRLQSGTVSIWNGSGFDARGNTDLKTAMSEYLLSIGWTREQVDDPNLQLNIFTFNQNLKCPAWSDNRAYDLIEVKYPVDSGDEYQSDHYLASMDYTAALPAWAFTKLIGYTELLEGAGLEDYPPNAYAAMGGKIYFFGANQNAAVPFTYVLAYSLQSGQWSWGNNLAGTALDAQTTVVSGDKMYIMFAKEGKEEKLSRSIRCFDGTDWSVLKDIPFVGRHSANQDETEGNIQAACAAAEYGLMMLNCSVDGGGSFFLYDLETGDCLPLYLTIRDGKADNLQCSSAVLAGDWLYLMMVKSALGKDAACELWRIPYRGLYATDKRSYSHPLGSTDPIVMTVKRSSVDWLTYGRFRRLLIGGKPVDAKYLSMKKGSLILTVSPEYLNTLAVGEYPAIVSFADGTATTTVIIENAVPQTGDSASPALWILCILAGSILVLALLRASADRR